MPSLPGTSTPITGKNTSGTETAPGASKSVESTRDQSSETTRIEGTTGTSTTRTRQVQASILRYLPLVSKMPSTDYKMYYIFVFREKQFANEFLEIFNMRYPSISDIHIYNMELAVNVLEDKSYLILLRFPFNINKGTIYTNFSNCLSPERLYFVYYISLKDIDFENDACATEQLTLKLNLLHKNNIPSIDFKAELEKEQLRKLNMNNLSSTDGPVKRKRFE